MLIDDSRLHFGGYIFNLFQSQELLAKGLTNRYYGLPLALLRQTL